MDAVAEPNKLAEHVAAPKLCDVGVLDEDKTVETNAFAAGAEIPTPVDVGAAPNENPALGAGITQWFVDGCETTVDPNRLVEPALVDAEGNNDIDDNGVSVSGLRTVEAGVVPKANVTFPVAVESANAVDDDPKLNPVIDVAATGADTYDAGAPHKSCDAGSTASPVDTTGRALSVTFGKDAGSAGTLKNEAATAD